MIFIVVDIAIHTSPNLLPIDYYKINAFYFYCTLALTHNQQIFHKKSTYDNISAKKQCGMLASPALCEAFSFIYPLEDSELYTSFSRVSLRNSWQ